jgi:signal transduction histidine kinase
MPRPRVDLVLLDRVLAAALTVALLLEVWLTREAGAQEHGLAVSLGWSVVTIGVAFRRRSPTLVALVASVVAVVEQTIWPSQAIASGVAWMCDIYGLAAWSSARRFRLGYGAYVGIDLLALFWARSLKSSVPFVVVSSIVVLLVRVVLGDRERRAQLAERERDVAAREAVVAERARIARELHDVIAHHVSMIVLQAGAERHALDGAQAQTRDVLTTIERTGRDALTEMRRLLGMLRDDGGDPLTPQPGLRDLPQLVAQVRDAGLPVELAVEGEPRDLPVGLDLSAFRIVQEALTNALKHAGDATARVRVAYGDDTIELEVLDDGGGTAAAPHNGGHGLVGMRERVALYGGRLEAQRRETGGYVVRALLPTR